MIYFDVQTTPGAVYEPIVIQFSMPQTGSLASASICSVELLTAGFYSSCAQKSFLNNAKTNRIAYSQT